MAFGMLPSEYRRRASREERILVEEYYRLLSLKEDARATEMRKSSKGTGAQATKKGHEAPKQVERPLRHAHR